MALLAEGAQLVAIPGGRDYEVMDRVFPYGRPEVRTFVERFAAQYRDACGERLVVTSLTRPFSEQPPNAHPLSVHPAGMTVDLRISRNEACRQFVESALLVKEAEGLLDITRERAPPHYHIAIFPASYGAWAAARAPLAEPPVASPRHVADATGGSGSRAATLMLAGLLGGVAAAYGVRSLVRARRGSPPAAGHMPVHFSVVFSSRSSGTRGPRSEMA